MSTLLGRLVIRKQRVAPVRMPFETLLLIGSWPPLLRGIAADMLALVIKDEEKNSWIQTFHLGDDSRTRPVHASLCLAEFYEFHGFLSRDEENSDTCAPLVVVEIDPLQRSSSHVGQDGFQRGPCRDRLRSISPSTLALMMERRYLDECSSGVRQHRVAKPILCEFLTRWQTVLRKHRGVVGPRSRKHSGHDALREVPLVLRRYWNWV
jgi:hypothetical protein